MYEYLKAVGKVFLPKRLLYKLEPVLRYPSYLSHKGERYRCNICDASLASFVRLRNGDHLCPRCGSIARNRRLWQLIFPELRSDALLLDFSPSRCLYRKFRANLGSNYVSTDFAGEFIADKRYDITQIDDGDDKYDLIICYHVLEHIPDDLKAMSELKRVLKKGGKCFIQTPFKDGDIYEDFSITSPADRSAHYGQEDHVRIYSVAALKQRLVHVGFKVEERHFKADGNDLHQMKKEEVVLVAMK